MAQISRYPALRLRIERLPGGACTHWKAPPYHGARQSTLLGLLILAMIANRRRPGSLVNDARSKTLPRHNEEGSPLSSRPCIGFEFWKWT